MVDSRVNRKDQTSVGEFDVKSSRLQRTRQRRGVAAQACNNLGQAWAKLRLRLGLVRVPQTMGREVGVEVGL